MGISVAACGIPKGSFLEAYVRDGGYTDCYVTDVPRAVSQAEYVEAFYTTWLFKAERLILSALSLSSSDQEVRELALGGRGSFAAWHVEVWRDDQLLMAAGSTRHCLMVDPGQGATRLYFGSAVVPEVSGRYRGRLAPRYQALLGFHRLYSRALLRAARGRFDR